MPANTSRREFLKFTAAGVGAAGLPRQLWADGYRSAAERPVLGFIGGGIRFCDVLRASRPFGPCAAIADVDATQLGRAKGFWQNTGGEKQAGQTPLELYADYRSVLDRADIDAVVISTPDHWHTKIAVEALAAGKDVYCEKPLTHTIAEGRTILDALEGSDRVFQVGTQQRSGRQFQTAAALCRSERAGKPKRLTCALSFSPTSDSLPLCEPPKGLDWDRWLGPAPAVPYRASPTRPPGGYGSQHPHSRCHAHFRWWYEYAGGKLTDWGAHHVDIAMWALNKSDGSIGPFTIEPLRVDHPVEFVDGVPAVDDRFNVATSFHLRVTFADGVELDILDVASDLGFDNGVMFQCERGRFFVNRGKLTGKPVEELVDNPLPEDLYAGLYPDADFATDGGHGERNRAQMKNFVDCLKSRRTPVSDVASHHRHLTVCHAANIAMRLGRKVTFDPATERFVGDDVANRFLAREYRKGYEIEA